MPKPSVWVYPNEKPDYYTFAHDRLFDKQDFFVLSGSAIFTPIPGLTITKTGPKNCNPCKVPNKTNIVFTITVSYSRDQQIAITDVFPPNTKLVGKPSGNFPDISSTQVVWHLTKETAQDVTKYPTPTWIFTLTLQPTQDNIEIKNIVDATIEGGPAGSGTPIQTPGGDKYANNLTICDIKWGFAPQNGFEINPTGRDFCKVDEYCDPRKSGDANPPKTGTPCTQVRNCTCDIDPFSHKQNNKFTCTNPGSDIAGNNTYHGNCQTSGKVCDQSIKGGFPCK